MSVPETRVCPKCGNDNQEEITPSGECKNCAPGPVVCNF